jgi:formate dehydrogenase subunit beta
MEQRLRSEARALLEQSKVDWIIGSEAGSLKFTTTPLITKDKNDTQRLVINPFIVNNLANFLIGIKGRVGIAVKGCDSRSVVSLIQDNKVARENLVILGIPCTGVIDLSKVEKLTTKDRAELDEITREGNKVTVKTDSQKKEFPVTQVLFDHCLACEFPTPKEYDILLGEPTPPLANPVAQEKIEKLKQLTPEQRWSYWEKELTRCIRCYACRNVCPACFCQRCFVEETEPQWVFPAPRWQDNLIFQIIRNIHVAGRCTDCGECERACPVNIPLRSLTREMYDTVAELFQFKAGMDKDTLPLMTHYEEKEAEEFFR